MSDDELYVRIKQGDGDALSALYDRYALQIAGIARRWTKDQHAVEEIIQDVFTRVWKTNAFNPEIGQFKHWLFVVARRIAIDHMRKRARVQEDSDSTKIETQMVETTDTDWLHEDLKRGMTKLKDTERIILVLAYFKGYTLAEISSTLGLPLGTVKTRLHYALKKMKSSMADWYLEA